MGEEESVSLTVCTAAEMHMLGRSLADACCARETW